MKFVSLFSGIGGLDYGFEQAGLECIAQVEIDPFCRDVLEKRFPHVPKFNDAEKFCRRIYDCEAETDDGLVCCPRCGLQDFGECECVGTDQFTDDHGFPDIIIGGDPCQANSNAKTHGRTAASLGGEFIRIVTELRPQYVLRENPSAVRKDAPWPWWRFANELERIGYIARPFRFRACCAGLDHRRERVFVFAVDAHANGAGLEGNERQELARTDEGRQDADIARPDRRYATPRICRGSDGIPRRMDRLRALGNAVAPPVAYVVAKAISEATAQMD